MNIFFVCYSAFLMNLAFKVILWCLLCVCAVGVLALWPLRRDPLSARTVLQDAYSKVRARLFLPLPFLWPILCGDKVNKWLNGGWWCPLSFFIQNVSWACSFKQACWWHRNLLLQFRGFQAESGTRALSQLTPDWCCVSITMGSMWLMMCAMICIWSNNSSC